jgi:hypothetical protein
MTGRWAAVLRVQITHLCDHQDWHSFAPATVQNGGSARGYQDPARAVGAPTKAVRQAVQTVCLCVVALSVNVRICRRGRATSGVAILLLIAPLDVLALEKSHAQ